MPRKTAGTPLPESFFHSRTALELAPALLGVHINIPAEGIVCRITETEAYMGAGDAACHASDGRRTARTEVMFRRGGIFYVYLIYGMYHCANIVSGKEGSGEAVLLRSVEILEGHDSASLRRYGKPYGQLSAYQKKNLCNGPGKLCLALGIDKSFNGSPCSSSGLYLSAGDVISASEVKTSARIGVEYAGDAALFPWRFYI